MPHHLGLFLVLAASFAGPVVAVLLLASRFPSYEKRILFGACMLTSAMLASGFCALIAIGGRDAHLTIENDSPQPIGLSAINVDRQIIPANESKKLFVPAGPGWIDGLIDDVVISMGPTFSTQVEFHGITGLEHGVIVITSESPTDGSNPQ